MRKDTELTQAILYQISKHLSSRKSCKEIEYVVEMQNSESGPRINMFPYVRVFPDTYHRKQIYEDSVVTHVLKYHVHIDVRNTIVPGTYIYKMSTTRKIRRWEKLPG